MDFRGVEWNFGVDQIRLGSQETAACCEKFRYQVNFDEAHNNPII